MGSRLAALSVAAAWALAGPAGASGGATWTPLGLEGMSATLLHAVPGTLYAAVEDELGNGLGVWRLELDAPGSQWEPLGPSGIRVRSILKLGSNPDQLLVGVHAEAPETTRVYRTDDGGASWVPSDSGTCASGGGGSRDVRVLRADPDEPGRILAGGSALFESLDNGRTWDIADTHPSVCEGGSNYAVWDIRFSPHDSLTIWLSAASGGFVYLYRSTDGGESWKFVYAPPFRVIRRLDFHPTDPGLLYCTDSTEFYRLVIGPFTWDPLLHEYWGLVGGHVDLLNPAELYVGVEEFVDAGYLLLFSPDDGATWTPLDEEGQIPTEGRLRWVERAPENPWRFYLGFESAGVWMVERGVVGVGAAGDRNIAPRELTVIRNPALDEVVFGVSGSPAAPGARLAIFDSAGRFVRGFEPASGVGAGDPGFRWDGRDRAGRDVPAGTYFAVAEVGGEHLVSKLVWLGR
jgi:hypothetical protein